MNLASMILALKDQIPGRSKDQVRAFISRIVEEINRLLADDIRRAVTAAVDRRRHSPFRRRRPWIIRTPYAGILRITILN